MPIAQLDRGVSVVSGPEPFRSATRISDLDNAQYVVLLGEPGLGKTVAFDAFANRAATESTSAFLFNSDNLDSTGLYFIDAIDEVSIQEARDIAQALRRVPGCRWRISCRTEDWSTGGRLSQAFGSQFAAIASDPVVVQLQPLDDDEALAVLQALGHPTPSAVISTLQTLSSTPFVMTPLGLRFLVTVAPAQLQTITRFELYETGVSHLATEHNQPKAESKFGPALLSIIDNAGHIFLMLLLAGKHGVHRSGATNSTSLSLNDIGLAPAEAAAALDTALFTTVNEQFVPFHRSIQEFLAARFLARLVVHGIDGNRLHIERALALIVTYDGRPTENLRPLYAWFTCHLANEKAFVDSERLAFRDPEALLLHGDVAKLPLSVRTHIVATMGQQDPYFRWSINQTGPVDSGLAGLITPEMSEQAFEILGAIEEPPHRLGTVLHALAAGAPIPRASEACWSVVMREETVFWCKAAAISAWANSANPSPKDLWERIKEVAEHDAGLSQDQPRLLAQLFCLIPVDQLKIDDVLRVLAFLQLNLHSGNGLQKSAPTQYAIRDICWHVAVPHLWRPLILETPKQWHLAKGTGSLEQRFAVGVCTAVFMEQNEVSLAEFTMVMLATGGLTGADGVMVLEQAAHNWILKQDDHDEVVRALLLCGDQEVADHGSIAMGLLWLGLRPNPAIVNWMLTDTQLLATYGPQYVADQVARWTLQSNESPPTWLIDLLGELKGTDCAEAVMKAATRHAENVDARNISQEGSVEAILTRRIPEWTADCHLVESADLTDALTWAGEVYLGHSPFSHVKGSGAEALRQAFGEPLVKPLLMGLAKVMIEDRRWDWCNAARMASVAILLERLDPVLQTLTSEQLLEILLGTDRIRDARYREQIDCFCVEQLSNAVHIRSSVLEQLAQAGDSRWSAFLSKLVHCPSPSPLHIWAARQAFTHPAAFSNGSAQSALIIAHSNLDEAELVSGLNALLERLPANSGDTGAPPKDWQDSARLSCAFYGACLRPTEFGDLLLDCMRQVDAATVFRLILDPYRQQASKMSGSCLLQVSYLIIHFVIEQDPGMSLYGRQYWTDTLSVLQCISASEDPRAETKLLDLLQQAEGTVWKERFRHELERLRSDLRAQSQRLISAGELLNVIAGRGPVDVQDLRALVAIVLQEIADDMQPSPLNPWRLFWREQGKGLNPRVENDCRDVLASKLADRLKLYGDFQVLIEAASSGGTRADLLVTCGEYAVPIEAKRTNHSHLWHGHSGQLQTYTLASNTSAQGIYVVFWFGKGLAVTASPTGVVPTSPQQLKGELELLLEPTLRASTSVIVLDLSDAQAAAKTRKDSGYQQDKESKPPRKRRQKSKTPLPSDP